MYLPHNLLSKSYQPLESDTIWQKKNPVVLYTHIPFCNNVCYCCIYNKYNTKGELVEKYLNALKREIEIIGDKPHIQDSSIISGYIGGGTPAVLSTEQLDGLLTHIEKHFDLKKDDPQFILTVETTPHEMDEEKADMLRVHGIVRISMGAQSFNTQLLRNIGRTHKGEDVKAVLEMLRKKGFPYICVDLMYGLPGQTLQNWEETMDEYLSVGADSLGIYPYLVIPNSKLYHDIQRGKLPPTPVQEELDEMFTLGVEKLLANGYIAVTPNELGKTTIENGEDKWNNSDIKLYKFGKDDYRGVVVSTFPLTTHIAHSWYEGGDLLGIGSGSYGYFRDYWYLNEPDINKYVDMLSKDELPVVAGSYLSAEEKIARFMVMGTKFLKLLRKDFYAKFGVDMNAIYKKQLDQLIEWDLIEMDDDSITVTYPKGWYYIDNINKTFYSKANYRMPQTTLSNTNILHYLKKKGARN